MKKGIEVYLIGSGLSGRAVIEAIKEAAMFNGTILLCDQKQKKNPFVNEISIPITLNRIEWIEPIVDLGLPKTPINAILKTNWWERKIKHEGKVNRKRAPRRRRSFKKKRR